jgi:hypothetical protein
MFGQPDLPPGLSGGGKTRMLNELNQAKSSSYGNNQSAQNSIQQVTGPLKRHPKSNVGGYGDAGSVAQLNQQPQQLQGPPAVDNSHSIGALSAQPEPQPEDPVERFNRNEALDKIVSSPDMMDTVTRLKLRNHFQGRPDDGIGTEALGIIKQMHGIG